MCTGFITLPCYLMSILACQEPLSSFCRFSFITMIGQKNYKNLTFTPCPEQLNIFFRIVMHIFHLYDCIQSVSLLNTFWICIGGTVLSATKMARSSSFEIHEHCLQHYRIVPVMNREVYYCISGSLVTLRLAPLDATVTHLLI